MTEIGQSIIKAVRARAAENPDFIYNVNGEEFCAYVRDGQPSCLIGHGLWDLHLIDSSLETDEDDNGRSVDELLPKLGLTLDQEEMEWLARAQESQDAMARWSQAVTWADEYDDEMLNGW